MFCGLLLPNRTRVPGTQELSDAKWLWHEGTWEHTDCRAILMSHPAISGQSGNRHSLSPQHPCMVIRWTKFCYRSKADLLIDVVTLLTVVERSQGQGESLRLWQWGGDTKWAHTTQSSAPAQKNTPEVLVAMCVGLTTSLLIAAVQCHLHKFKVMRVN